VVLVYGSSISSASPELEDITTFWLAFLFLAPSERNKIILFLKEELCRDLFSRGNNRLNALSCIA